MITTGSALHFGRCAQRDRRAEVDDEDPIGDVHDQTHVVLDHDHRDVQLVAYVEHEAGHVLGLFEIHAGNRLVEEQQLRFHRQRTSELDPFLHPDGSIADRMLSPLLEFQEVDDVLGCSPVTRAPRSARPATTPWRKARRS